MSEGEKGKRKEEGWMSGQSDGGRLDMMKAETFPLDLVTGLFSVTRWSNYRK